MSSSVAAGVWAVFSVALFVGLWAEEAEGAEREYRFFPQNASFQFAEDASDAVGNAAPWESAPLGNRLYLPGGFAAQIPNHLGFLAGSCRLLPEYPPG